MIPPKNRRIIEAVFDLHGRDLPLVADDRVSLDTFYIVGEYGEKPYIKGHPRYINWARDILSNDFVPETYDDAASTWG